MTNSIKIFENNQFGQIRTIDKNGEPWFVATDVCQALDIQNTTDALKRLDDDERSRFNLGRQGDANMVNEFGLYNLVLASRKPEAREFKRWITHEVIPTIRKTGGYSITSVPRTFAEALRLAADQAEQLALNAPKVIFADAVSVSHTTILVGDLAKILKQNGIDIGANRLFVWLRENGYLIRRAGMDYNMPTQTSMDLGLFSIKETAITHSDGHISISKTTKVTGKGQQYFITKFLKEAI